MKEDVGVVIQDVSISHSDMLTHNFVAFSDEHQLDTVAMAWPCAMVKGQEGQPLCLDLRYTAL